MTDFRLALRLCLRHRLLSLAAIGTDGVLGAGDVATAATLIPARRAMRANPIIALRDY